MNPATAIAHEQNNMHHTFLPGLVLQDTYRIVGRVGTGGDEEIYEATHVRLQKSFAIRVVRPEVAGNQPLFRRMRRETELLSALGHPNIVQVFDVSTTPDGTPYVVTEYFDWKRPRLDGEPPALLAVVSIVHQVAAALGAAHGCGLVHGALTPDSVVVLPTFDHDVLAKVLDFGIATGGWSGRVSVGKPLAGTRRYLAPEQVRRELLDPTDDGLDARADQFALAVMASEMLAGREAFSGKAAAVLDRAMAERREDRFGSVQEMARAFAAALRGDLRTARRPLGAPRKVDDEGFGSANSWFESKPDPAVHDDVYEERGIDWRGNRGRKGVVGLVVSATALAFVMFAIGWRTELSDAAFVMRSFLER